MNSRGLEPGGGHGEGCLGDRCGAPRARVRRIKSEDPAVARAQAFLIKAQREVGSWPMTSRPRAQLGIRATSLVPIIGAGSAWAVLGLVRSRGPSRSSRRRSTIPDQVLFRAWTQAGLAAMLAQEDVESKRPLADSPVDTHEHSF